MYMIEDRPERRMYRKSPGRQYGYQYDPLQSQSLSRYGQQGRSDASVQSESWDGHDETGSRSNRRTSGLLAPRPNPRRTRQLLRQNIIASKSKSALLDDTGQLDPELRGRYALPDEDPGIYESEVDPTLYSNRYPRTSQLLSPPPEQYIEEEFDEEQLAGAELQYMDPDPGYDEYEDYDPLANRLPYTESPRARSTALRAQPEIPERGRRYSAPLDYDVEEQEEVPARRKQKKKKGLSRRKLLIGAVAVGGGAVAAYELVPHLPQALEQAGTNIEHQLQDAFNKGLAAGGEAVRKELINSLDTLEGVSLDAAIGAARLTRVAYDVFVSPLVTLAATIADDFLSALLGALTTARRWLNSIQADNATLAALQAVLQSWVNQIQNMPKKLQTITDTDLDGAQAYLRALQRKIQAEQAKLNGQGTTPTPAPTAKPKP
jgi:hypothetical protein